MDGAAGASAPNCGTAADPCASIADAIDLASDGDTVSVASGTYAEQLVFDKAITLSGAGAGSTILTADGASPTVSGAGLLQIDGQSATGDIVVEGFTIRDAGPANIKSDGQAIYARASGPIGGTTTLRNNEFLVGDSSDPDMVGPVGLYLRPGGRVVIETNTFDGFWQALLAERSGDMSVVGNTFTNLQPVMPQDYEPLGVYVLWYLPGPSPDFHIEGNTFTGFAGIAIALSSGYPGKEAECAADGCHVAARILDNVFDLDASPSSGWQSSAISASSRDAENRIGLDMSGNTGTVAGATDPVVFRPGAGEIHPTNTAGIPNTITPATETGEPGLSLTLDGPADITADREAGEFTATGSNVFDEPVANLRYDLTITAPEALTADDIAVANENTPGSGTFEDVPLTVGGSGELVGSFGPLAGSPLDPGDHPVRFTAAIGPDAPIGPYAAELSIVHVDDDGAVVNTMATETVGFDVGAPPPDIAVTKTIDATIGHEHDWQLQKSGEIGEITIDGDTAAAEVTYTVTATPGDRHDGQYQLSGEIEVTNQTDALLRITVTEEADVGTDATCTVTTPDGGDADDLPIEAAETLQLDYDCTLDGDPNDGSTTTLVSWFGGEAETSLDEPVEFSTGPAPFQRITVLDDHASGEQDWIELGTAEWNDDGTPAVFTYTQTHDGLVLDDCSTITNTAMIAETEQIATADIDICPEADATGGPDDVADTAPPAWTLPYTGINATGLLGIAATLLTIGGATLIARRRWADAM